MASTQIASSNIQANAALDFSGRAGRGVKTDMVSRVGVTRVHMGKGKRKPEPKLRADIRMSPILSAILARSLCQLTG